MTHLTKIRTIHSNITVMENSISVIHLQISFKGLEEYFLNLFSPNSDMTVVIS